MRTLKDFDKIINNELIMLTKDNLRKEAIKWLKWIDSGRSWLDHTDDVVSFIMTFFNITEEDLK